MAKVKRTFTLPDDISEALDVAIPSRERSSFVAHTLREALRKKKRDALLHLLDQLPRNREPDGVRAEDVLRDIRDGRADDILAGARR